jgi:hypothetical protein
VTSATSVSSSYFFSRKGAAPTQDGPDTPPFNRMMNRRAARSQSIDSSAVSSSIRTFSAPDSVNFTYTHAFWVSLPNPPAVASTSVTKSAPSVLVVTLPSDTRSSCSDRSLTISSSHAIATGSVHTGSICTASSSSPVPSPSSPLHARRETARGTARYIRRNVDMGTPGRAAL